MIRQSVMMEGQETINRRRMLQLAGTGFTVAVAGCSGEDPSTATDDTSVSPGTDSGTPGSDTPTGTDDGTPSDTPTETPTRTPTPEQEFSEIYAETVPDKNSEAAENVDAEWHEAQAKLENSETTAEELEALTHATGTVDEFIYATSKYGFDTDEVVVDHRIANSGGEIEIASVLYKQNNQWYKALFEADGDLTDEASLLVHSETPEGNNEQSLQNMYDNNWSNGWTSLFWNSVSDIVNGYYGGESEVPDSMWEKFDHQNDDIVIGNQAGANQIGFTEAGLKAISQFENPDNYPEVGDAALEFYKKATETFYNDVIEQEDNYLEIDMDNEGRVKLDIVGKDRYQELVHGFGN